MKRIHHRDYYAGALVMLLGAGAAVVGSHYDLGSLRSMGPGFFPTVLGIMLAFIGVLIAGSASVTEPSGGAEPMMRPDWRGWFCIVSAAGLFIALAAHGGLVPAIMACVFVAALGDRGNSWLEALLLATGITIFGTLLFVYVLHVQIPMFGSM